MANLTLLCDLGGTHARLGLLEGDTIQAQQKFRIADYQTHNDLFDEYLTQQNSAPLSIMIAASDCHMEGSNPSGFVADSKLSESGLRTLGFSNIAFFNDFEASAWGAAACPQEKLSVWRPAESDFPESEHCLVGPGTGLGTAFFRPAPVLCVRPHDFGANMRPCAVTAEHHELLQDLQAQQKEAVTYEDIASGRGLKKLYQLFVGEELQDLDDLLSRPDHEVASTILRLFHEFLGLYIQNLMISAHAYGGIVLHGGLLDVLVETKVFDFDQVFHMVDQPYLPVVRSALRQTPIFYLNDTYLALKGLKALAQNAGSRAAA